MNRFVYVAVRYWPVKHLDGGFPVRAQRPLSTAEKGE